MPYFDGSLNGSIVREGAHGAGEHGLVMGASEFRRPWNDGSSVSLTVSFTRYLLSRPGLDDVTHFLVALLTVPVGALGAAIVSTNGANVETIAQYVDLVPGWPADDPVPLLAARFSDALSGMAYAVPVQWTDSEVLQGQAVTVWPLGSHAGSVETLVLIHATQLDLAQVKERAEDLAEILAVYMLSRPLGASVADDCEVAPTLTSRQQLIIELMAHGFTNRQIASRIGFSESTVHLEALNIYRVLGVHSRHGAVSAAEGFGLINPDKAPIVHRTAG